MPYESTANDYKESHEQVSYGTPKEEGPAKNVLTIAIIIAIGLMLLSIMFGLLAFVIRYAVPIAAIVLVVYFLKKR